jgi:hypothetical protein
MRAQGGEIKGPLGLWSFPVLNSLSSSMRSEGVEVTGPLGMWSFPILSSVLSGSQIRVSFGPGRSQRALSASSPRISSPSSCRP